MRSARESSRLPRSLGNASAVAVAFLLAACQPDSTPVAAPVPSDPAQAANANAADVAQERGPGDYIVVFKDEVRDVPGAARSAAAAAGGRMGYLYQNTIKGFSITVGSAQAAEALTRNPNVDYIEADQEMTASATQTGATWGLDRIDQRNLPLNGSYNYSNTGSGVTAYIVDTGIRLSHTQFGGRARAGFDAFGGNGDDCDGHGTHVSGTVGGATYGVAKDVQLVAVRVLNCSGSGTTSGVIAGIDYVAAQTARPAVANMSLGGNASTALDNAVKNAVAKGITFVVAAGNSNRDACKFSPARAATAITVGATTSSDARASYSNYGSCLDIFAPGSSITSAGIASNTATATYSGTSMASPHVAGVAALYLQGNPGASPAAVAAALTSGATANKVGNAGRNSPNLLLFSNY